MKESTLGIKVSRITQKCELKFVEGYMWKTDEETKKHFKDAKKADADFKEGRMCLDLINTNGDLLDTITLTKEDYNRLRR